MRVCLAPYYHGADKADGGIRRVIEALVQHLPAHGWDVTMNPDEADVIHCHGTTYVERPGIPLIASSHGMMWEDYFAHYADDVNKACVDLMIRANAVTAPSQWVAHAIARGLLVRPEVIYHGVDADAWAPKETPLDYVLWNKARIDPVSDPRDALALARLMPDTRFLTTYGEKTDNVLPIGVGTYEQMMPVVQRAAVYLATTRETFGIGTLEAMAAGVPIAGWDYGGQSEIVTDGETGYLAPFGDLEALRDCVRRCLAERSRLGKNARDDAIARWGWSDKIAQYAALYTRTVEAYRAPRPKVSVVITAYNMERYLNDAVDSVIAQSMRDWELVITDDYSDDRTGELSKALEEWDKRIHYVCTPKNLGLSGARNFGFEHARGKYILFLDADDLLAPNALDVLSTALDRDSALHIAYGSLDIMAHDGTHRRRNPWPTGAFSWHAQIAHLNQLHGSSLMRREVLERSGGYRVRDWRAEDASFWARVTSFGFRAEKVTEESVQIYRMHEQQKSRGEQGDGDWTAWLPWRIAGDAHTGLEAMRTHVQPNARIVPFGAQGKPPLPMRAWPVRHHQHPVVSIVIPVGPGHADVLVDALDSVQAQTMPEWECIVVNDTGADLNLRAWPWVRSMTGYGTADIDGRRSTHPAGAGAVRNLGLYYARAPLTVFLDADDVLHPRFLEETLKTYVASEGKYVYTDFATLEGATRIDGEVETHTVEEYDAHIMLSGLRHAVTALVPTDWLRDVGGFNEELPCFEDWDLYCKLAIKGYCGTRCAQPLLIYRHQHGQRTRTALKPRKQGQTVPAYTDLGEKVAGAVIDRYSAYVTGEETIMGCCGSSPVEIARADDALQDMVAFMMGADTPQIPDSGMVRMEFVGDQEGAQTFIGKVSGRQYRAGREPMSRYHDVDARDVEWFIALGKFAVVNPEVLAAAVAAEPEAYSEAFHAPSGPVVIPKPKGRKVKE